MLKGKKNLKLKDKKKKKTMFFMLQKSPEKFATANHADNRSMIFVYATKSHSKSFSQSRIVSQVLKKRKEGFLKAIPVGLKQNVNSPILGNI